MSKKPYRCEICGRRAPLSKFDKLGIWVCSKCYKELSKKYYGRR